MSDATDTRDRVIRVESELGAHIKRSEEAFRKLDEVHELLLQAKGARWVIIGMAGIAGFISAKLGSLLPWLGGMPR